MLGYATVGSNDLERAKAFYDALFAAVGISTLFDHGSGGRVYGAPGGPMFGVVGPFDGKPASVGNGSMFGFALPSHELSTCFIRRRLNWAVRMKVLRASADRRGRVPIWPMFAMWTETRFAHSSRIDRKR